MSSGFQGMDIDEVGNVKRGVAETGSSIDDMVKRITGFVQGLQNDPDKKWIGRDADNFREKFEGFAPLARQATEKIGQRSAELNKRIEAQQQASGG